MEFRWQNPLHLEREAGGDFVLHYIDIKNKYQGIKN
jgi:hypothetical protein